MTLSKNSVAVVTGAGSGIGRALAIRLAAEKIAGIAMADFNETGLNETFSMIENLGISVSKHLIDVSNLTQVQQLAEEVITTHGRATHLINNAGVGVIGSFQQISLEDFEWLMNINFWGVIYGCNVFLPILLEQDSAHIVNVSSVSGTRSFPNVLAYCVSKAGVDQLTRCAALELAPKGIRVNAVNPGVVVSNLHKRGGMVDEDYKKFLENSKNTHPLGRVGEAKEVADLIYFLASEKASWITGATYEIDGGRAQTCAR